MPFVVQERCSDVWTIVKKKNPPERKRGGANYVNTFRDLYTIVELRLNLSFEKKKKTFADLEKKFFAFFGELGC